MPRLERRGLFLFAVILFILLIPPSYNYHPVFALDLETIVVSKKPSFPAYPAGKVTVSEEASSWPQALSASLVDLQSRNLKGGIQTDFSLRGAGYQGTLFLVDGQRINDPQTAHHNCDIPLTLEDIERIEIMPGVTPATFGPDAIGGAVNITLKPPEEKKRVLSFGFGEHRLKEGLLSISNRMDKLGYRLTVENQESGGFKEDTDYKKFTANLTSRLSLPAGDLDSIFGYQEKEFGAYDFYTPGRGYPSKEWTKTYFFKTGMYFSGDYFTFSPKFTWRRHYDKFMLDKTQRLSNYLNHHRTDSYTPGVYLSKDTLNLGKLGIGLEYPKESIRSTNLGNHSRERAGVFLDAVKDLGLRANLAFSCRYEKISASAYAPTGSFNFKYNMSGRGSLRAGISRNIRLPSFTELYYDDPTTIGNSLLSCEKSFNYEAGYDYIKKPFSFGATFFLRQESDMIDWVKSSPALDKWKAENISCAHASGIENYLKIKINPGLTFGAGYTYINKRQDDKGFLYKYGQNYVRHLVNMQLVVNMPWATQGILNGVYKKRPVRKGWFLLDGYFTCKMNKNSAVFLKADNIFDVDYEEIEGIAQPGRWLEAGIKLTW
ncbi:MAG: TonB-dependent receptor [Candidatus Omnitrophota bacterium]